MKKFVSLSLGAALFLLSFILLLIAGWISNIIQLVTLAQADQFTAMFIVKCIGVLVAPVGSILGIVGWF